MATTVVAVGEPGTPVTLDRLRAACPSCVRRLHPEPTAEQLLAEELEQVADEPMLLHVFDRATGEVLATDRLSNTRGSWARAQIERDARRADDEDDLPE